MTIIKTLHSWIFRQCIKSFVYIMTSSLRLVLFLPSCEMKISPAILISKKCHSHQRFLVSKCEWELPKLWSSRCCHPSQWLLRSWGNVRCKMNKETGLAPDSWGAYERSELGKPKGLHLPIHRMLNSLTWYLIFDIQAAFSLCYRLVYILTFSAAFLEQFSQSYWDPISWALSS